MGTQYTSFGASNNVGSPALTARGSMPGNGASTKMKLGGGLVSSQASYFGLFDKAMSKEDSNRKAEPSGIVNTSSLESLKRLQDYRIKIEG